VTYLLDTLALLWWIEGSGKLKPTIVNLLDDPSNELLISIATPWELAIKTNSGKIDASRLLGDIEQGLLGSQVELLQTETRHAIRAGLLYLHHRDPFDRLIIAQSLDLKIPIVSNNRVFDLYGVQRIWD